MASGLQRETDGFWRILLLPKIYSPSNFDAGAATVDLVQSGTRPARFKPVPIRFCNYSNYNILVPILTRNSWPS